MRKAISQETVETEIQVIRDVLREQIKPVAAYLFGSSVEGKMTDQSDYDLLVVMRDVSGCKKAKKLFASTRKKLPRRPFDVLWFTQEEFNRKKDMGGATFIAVREGRKLV